ncbi:alpha/beta hydrolase [Nocardia cyriacigeorgica]|nr:alpha/beta hydrolase fold domain-containing protein [Nocardia cyriacigeorgica]
MASPPRQRVTASATELQGTCTTGSSLVGNVPLPCGADQAVSLVEQPPHGDGEPGAEHAPAYIATAEFDPNRDEGMDYALRLLQAGVSVELHEWAGTFHGSQALPAEVSQRQSAELCAALRRAMSA